MDYTNPNTVTFEDGLELTGFSWAWDGATYKRGEATTQVTVLMELPGGGLKYSRTLDIPRPGAWDEAQLNSKLLKLPEFTGSTPI